MNENPYAPSASSLRGGSRRWELEETSPEVIIWWILWLIVEVLDNGMYRFAQQARTLQQFQEVTSMNFICEVISLPLYLVARHIVRRVWRAQSESYLQMSEALDGQ